MILQSPLKLELYQAILCKKCEQYQPFVYEESLEKNKDFIIFAIVCKKCGDINTFTRQKRIDYRKFISHCEAIDRLIEAIKKEKNSKNKKKWNKYSEETLLALSNYKMFELEEKEKIKDKVQNRNTKNIKKDYLKSINVLNFFEKTYGTRKTK